MFDIEKDIPLPPEEKRKTGRIEIYPFKQMEVGESFFVPNTVKSSKTVRCIASNKNKVLFPQRFITQESKNGTRVWRIA